MGQPRAVARTVAVVPLGDLGEFGHVAKRDRKPEPEDAVQGVVERRVSVEIHHPEVDVLT